MKRAGGGNERRVRDSLGEGLHRRTKIKQRRVREKRRRRDSIGINARSTGFATKKFPHRNEKGSVSLSFRVDVEKTEVRQRKRKRKVERQGEKGVERRGEKGRQRGRDRKHSGRETDTSSSWWILTFREVEAALLMFFISYVVYCVYRRLDFVQYKQINFLPKLSRKIFAKTPLFTPHFEGFFPQKASIKFCENLCENAKITTYVTTLSSSKPLMLYQFVIIKSIFLGCFAIFGLRFCFIPSFLFRFRFFRRWSLLKRNKPFCLASKQKDLLRCVVLLLIFQGTVQARYISTGLVSGEQSELAIYKSKQEEVRICRDWRLTGGKLNDEREK